ncbi:hypothetical protein H6758_04410 [Candidatus Nomurabacteria bacterium]|nr:hypothetical protein [Candidatus Nomurabacteria bacterium]
MGEKKRPLMNWKWSFAAIMMLIIALMLYLVHLKFFSKTQIRPLETLFSESDAGVILVDNVEYSTSPQHDDQMFVYRLRDAKKMNLVGQWDFNFMEKKQLALYPHFVSEKKLYLVSEHFLYPRAFEDLPDKIDHVSVSPSDHFVLVRGTSQSATSSEPFFCLFAKNGDQTSCSSLPENIFADTHSDSQKLEIDWLPEEDNTLVIHNTSHENLSLYDPMKKLLIPVKKEWIENRNKHTDTFTKNVPSIQKISQYPFYVKITLSNDQTKYYWINPLSHVVQATEKHILLQAGKDTSILNVLSGKMSEFAKLPHRKSVIYTPYNSPV